MEGQIIKIISNLYSVKINNEVYECRARGKFRNDKITPTVGDKCIIDCKNCYIIDILPRKNTLERPLISNVDSAVIVTSVKQPELSFNLLDKMISLVLLNKIEPIICFTKIDLLGKKEFKELKKIMAYYKKIGYKVTTNKKVNKLCSYLKDKVVVFTGQTGAGKSSLLNKIDKNLNLKTGEISQSLGRGKHTTRHVELFEIKKFYVADTPGFSSLDLNNFTKEEIKKSFIEFDNYLCEYKDCNHIKERNCNVKNAVEKQEILKTRYNDYLSFISKL